MHSEREIPAFRHRHSRTLQKISGHSTQKHQKVATEYVSDEESLFLIETGMKKASALLTFRRKWGTLQSLQLRAFTLVTDTFVLVFILTSKARGVVRTGKAKPCNLASEFYTGMKRRNLFSSSLV